MKEMTEMILHSKTASYKNCVKLTIDNDALNKTLEEKSKIEKSMAMNASNKVIDSNSCAFCAKIGADLDEIQEAFRVKFKEQLSRIRNSSYVSCETLKLEVAIHKERYAKATKSNKYVTCEDLAKENDYLKKTIKIFSSGKRTST